MTSFLCRRPPSPRMPRLLPAKWPWDDVRTAARPGNRPINSVVSIAAPTANARTTRLVSTRAIAGNASGAASRARRTSPVAASTPHNPPTHDRMMLSATICEASCRRAAPSAARTISSCRRAEARASSRFPTLAQAMSSTRPTAPSSASRIARRSPTRSSARLTTLTPTSRFASGCSRASRVATAAAAARARSTLSSPRSRAMPVVPLPTPRCRKSGSSYWPIGT